MDFRFSAILDLLVEDVFINCRIDNFCVAAWDTAVRNGQDTVLGVAVSCPSRDFLELIEWVSIHCCRPGVRRPWRVDG
jgi:hypothetical protein